MPWSTPAPPGTQPPLSPAEMDLLVARTGLTLNPGQMADLVLAWRQVAGLIAAIPRSTVPADDQAFVFRLPGPPAPAALSKIPAKPKPKAKPAGKARTAAKINAVAKTPGARKPKAKKPLARKAAKPARKR
jgi:hypothetical protein